MAKRTRMPTDLNQRAKAIVDLATGAYGAFEGRVQTISNRGGLRFTLFDLLHDKAVSCYLAEGQQDIMADVWGRMAVVEGWVTRDPRTGRPRSVRRVRTVTAKGDGLPDGWRQARGAVPVPIGALSAEAAIRRIRDADELTGTTYPKLQIVTVADLMTMPAPSSQITIRIHAEDEGLWAEVLELPGCFASGSNIEELEEALQEAVSLYLSTADAKVHVTFGPVCTRPREEHTSPSPGVYVCPEGELTS